MFEQLINKYRPVFTQAAGECRDWGTQVLRHLEVIRDALDDDGPDTLRLPRRVTGQGATPRQVLEVPSGTNYLLEGVSARHSAALNNIVVLADGQVLWAASAGAATVGSWGGNDMRAFARQAITVLAEQDADVLLQWRTEAVDAQPQRFVAARPDSLTQRSGVETLADNHTALPVGR